MIPGGNAQTRLSVERVEKLYHSLRGHFPTSLRKITNILKLFHIEVQHIGNGYGFVFRVFHEAELGSW